VKDPIADLKRQPDHQPTVPPTGILICICCGQAANATARWGGLRFDICEACEGTTLEARLTGELHEVKLKSGYRFDAKERELAVLCPAHGERKHHAPFQKQTRLF